MRVLIPLVIAVSAGPAVVETTAVGALRSSSVIAPGQVANLSAPLGVSTRSIGDQLAGDNFVAKVQGVALVDHAAGAQTVSAPPGDQLLLLGLGVTCYQPPFSSAQPTPAPSVTVTAGGLAPVSLELSAAPDSNTAGDTAGYAGLWAVGIPDGAPVTLTLAHDGFTQSLDLRAGRRSGTVPDVLYRQADPESLDKTSSVMRSISGTVRGQSVAFPVTVDEYALSYFAPYSTRPAPRPDEAYLTVDIGAPNTTDGSYAPIDPIPTSALSLRLLDGTLIPAQGTANPGPGLVDGTYSFVVPASLTDATLMVTPPATIPVTGDGGSVAAAAEQEVAATVGPARRRPA